MRDDLGPVCTRSEACVLEQVVGCAQGARIPTSNKGGGASSLLGPVYPSFRALSGRLTVTARRRKFNKDYVSFHARVLWGVAENQFPRKAVVFKRGDRLLRGCWMNLPAPTLWRGWQLRADALRTRLRSDVIPHGGVRNFRQKSTCITQLTRGPYVVQIRPRSTPKSGPNKTLLLH